MKDLTTAKGVIELVCDGDRSIGRKIITLGEMIELEKMDKKEKNRLKRTDGLVKLM